MASRGGAADGAPLSLATDRAEVAAAAGGRAALAPTTAALEQQRRRTSVSSEISEQGAGLTAQLIQRRHATTA